jgi:hypothetical protein
MSIICFIPHVKIGSYKFILLQKDECYTLIARDVEYHADITITSDMGHIVGGGHITIVHDNITFHGKSDKYGSINYTNTIQTLLTHAFANYIVHIQSCVALNDVSDDTGLMLQQLGL